MSASEPLAHLYDLALRALDEQERRAEAIRGRLGPVLAAAALGVSLLGPGDGGTAAGLAGTLAIVVALAGLTLTIVAALRILGVRGGTGFEPDVRELATALNAEGVLDDATSYYTAMIARLGDQLMRNIAHIDRVATAFTVMLCGIIVLMGGLALATIVG